MRQILYKSHTQKVSVNSQLLKGKAKDMEGKINSNNVP